MTIADIFHLFIIAHITSGSVGLVAFWVPVAGKKGGKIHGLGGKVFTVTMLMTGSFAVIISLCTLIDPVGTHPHLMSHPDFGSAEPIRTIFGWLMIYLAVLTINLAWYGWLCITKKQDRAAMKEWRNLALQGVLTVASVNCVVQGLLTGQFLMIGMSIIGFATVGTNLYFLYKPNPGRVEWLMEHIKALVGAGISVYTAFFAFGAVRLMPELALTPGLWAVPLVVGLALIIYHRRAVEMKAGRAAPALEPSTP